MIETERENANEQHREEPAEAVITVTGPFGEPIFIINTSLNDTEEDDDDSPEPC